MAYRDPYDAYNTDYTRQNYHGYEEQNSYNPYTPHAGAATSRMNTVRSTTSTYNNRENDELPPLPESQLPAGRSIPMQPELDQSSPPRGTLRKNTLRDPVDRMDSRHSLTPLTKLSDSAGDIKRWRKDYRRNLWTRGSRVSCIGRFFCCTLMIFLLLLISVVLSLVLWVRPPQVLFNGIQTAQSGSTFEATTNNEFKINLGFNIFVKNPNYFSATFNTLSVDITYPINNTDVGGGEENGITFHAHTNTNFTFPFSFVYDRTADPQQTVINDLITKCGLLDPSQKQDLTIGYKIKIRLKVLVASVGPTFSGNANFDCPLNADELKPFLAGLGISIPGVKRDPYPWQQDYPDALGGGL